MRGFPSIRIIRWPVEVLGEKSKRTVRIRPTEIAMELHHISDSQQ